MSLWPGAKRPDLTGKNVIITGANSGIGYYTALELAKAGADVVLACRSAAKGESATAQVNAQAPGRAQFMQLDLADFASVHHHNLIGFENSRQAVRDCDDGAPLREAIQSRLNLALRLGIEGRHRLVQQQHRRIFKQSAGNRDPLLLTA